MSKPAKPRVGCPLRGQQEQCAKVLQHAPCPDGSRDPYAMGPDLHVFHLARGPLNYKSGAPEASREARARAHNSHR